MKENEIKGLNESIYEYTLSNGLKIYMWKNDLVNGCFMSLSVKYGSIHTNFKVGNKKYNVPFGLAHFLEHIKFNLAEEEAAHERFYKLGGDANAFTTFDYTSYVVYASTNLHENLRELINFVYKPFFSKKIIQKEKGIIVEESNMSNDDWYSKAYFNLLKDIYHNRNYKEIITGEPDDIRAITIEDIENVFHSFYHPENMFMCITGNFNPYEILKTIEESMSTLEFPEFKQPIIPTKKEPKTVVRDYEELSLSVSNPKLKMAIKLMKSSFKGMDEITLRSTLTYLVSTNFGQASEFNEMLVSKGLVTYFGASRDFYGDTILITFTADTDYPEEVLRLIREKLDNLDISEKEFLRKKRGDLASLILSFNDIESVNNLIQSSIMNYGEVLYDIKQKTSKITYDDFLKTFSLLDLSNQATLIVVPKEDN